MRKLSFRKVRLYHLVALGYVCAAVGSVSTATATPQFARQTKLPCSSCHTHVPLLNEYGQRFYANG
ncbi:MAG TPA: hypothetical protein VG944_18515, partial [Fimbriimonas sp.]|nr:hypothetical protein [Fimbriimonas sp.]